MNQVHTQFKISLIATSISLVTFSSTSHATGFGLIEQSVTGLSAAFSTGTTSADDGSTIYFNPAGMSFLKNRTASTFGAHIIAPSSEFKDEDSTVSSLLGGANLNVNNENGGNAGSITLVPNFYYTRAIDNQWTAGIGITVPFGSTTSYNDGWVGRYYALRSELKTIDINPSFAYKANKTLSFGFGVSAQYIYAASSNAVDFGSICFAQLGAGTCTGANLTPQADDGEAEVTGDNWGIGFNLGLMWQATPETRIGVAYRSKIKHSLEGEVDFDIPNNTTALALATGAGLVDGGVQADTSMPDSFSVGFQYQASNNIAFNGDLTWTNWSELQELRFDFDNVNAADNVTTLEWENSLRYSLGMTYKKNSKWTWRTGIAFDETATPNDELISPRSPDEDRTWITAGFSYKPSSTMSIDFGYAHLFVGDAVVNKQAGPGGSENFFKGNLVGEYEIDVHIISAQARWNF